MLFSIVIPTYNYADYLHQALESVLKQQYHDYEVVVVDDGSTDHTEAVLAKIRPLFGSKLNVVKQANAGPGAARNNGVKAANGEFILFLDADDHLKPDALVHYRKAISDNRQSKLFIAGHSSGSERGETKHFPGSNLQKNGLADLRAYMHKEVNLCNGAMLMAKSLFDTIQFPEKLRLCEDIPVFAQALATNEGITIPQSVVNIRKHDQSRRHDVDALLQSIDTLPGLVFNPDVMPKEMYSLKREFTARMYLRAFRSLYLHGRYREARQYYYRALKAFPKAALLSGYAGKYLKSFIKRANKLNTIEC